MKETGGLGDWATRDCSARGLLRVQLPVVRDELDLPRLRDLLLAVRQELVRKYFAQPGIQINEVAFQLGYEDTNSFYRAFRNWEGTTPSQWRTNWKETGVPSLS